MGLPVEAITIDGYSLGAIAIVSLLVILLARIVARMMKDHGVRVARIGIFIERKRVEEIPPLESWTPDPLRPSREQETHPAPMPPPLPPADEPTSETWPQREESP